ncbi:MAG: TrkH family potassium uptake protein [Gammaproteobacteria bacterium]|nr:TrkH family potassium uptake protein [Rhodocyclaceae bacterium]MBU3909253.1 TrkH family potassium uptake protein [Gammaproteobacteria bacterium]MBU3989639.1 TrkH family potassium uptake protein [Gammaproteobacteria bacterium]MBU4005587.1 TrkH family potassium uptake protein [Gammaproteobacteria bacterium]MBU4020860.1 TrkH family potassium uptake protein [Gammaproteobacteria bacterium]
MIALPFPRSVLRFYPLLRVFGVLLIGFSLTLLVPLILSWWWHDGATAAYDEAFVLTFGSGLGLWWMARHQKDELKIRDGFLMVVMVWVLLPAFACLPLILQLNLSFTDAYFEAVSGLTTTGATVLANIDTLPPSINLWRGMLVWLGGMGLIVLAVAVLPLLGIGGRQMFKAETPGPMKDAQLTPRMAQTAKGLWVVYAAITLACALAYKLAGMDWFDAVMHAFTTMGLGGFSSHDSSFEYWNSPAIEMVAIIFMLIAGMNFATHFLAVHRQSLAPYRRDPEAGWFLVVTLGSVLGIALYLWQFGVYPEFTTALRFAAFNVVSIATTTGYANTDYNLWPIFAPLWMLLLSCFATSAGSTGGGLKMVRAMILYKQVYRELIRAMHPSAVWPVRIGGKPVPGNILSAVMAFGFIYMVSISLLTLLMIFSGLEIVSAFSAVVASINNTGPGLNQVGPATTFAILTDFQTWICTFAMLLGRLEMFTLLVVLTPAFWRI